MLKVQKLKRLEFLLSTTITLLLLFAIARFFVFGSLFKQQKTVDLATEKRMELMYLADELRQTSESLTQFARDYVVTGNLKHRKFYFDILKIRNGEIARPKGISLIYWDRLTKSGIQTTSKDGKPLSLLQIAKNEGLSKKEFNILKHTKQLSDSLAIIEKTAFDAMIGRYKDSNGNYIFTNKPNQKAAINLLFGKEYHDLKMAIMRGINDFNTSLNARIQNQVNHQKTTLNNLILAIFSLGIMTAIDFIFVVYFHIRIKRNASEAYKKIESYSESLAESNASKTKFFSIIAHDLRTPFIGFLGLTQLLAEETKNLNAEEVQDFSIAMKKSAENLYELLENLLEWANLEGGLTNFNPENLNVLEITDKNVELHQDFASKKQIALINSVSENTKVLADKRMLNILLRNLISNAIKFTPKGGQIEIGIEKTNVTPNFHTIYVKDNGMGMSEKTIENIFKINTKTSDLGTEGEKGTGLGLILCQEFIKKSNGNIWIESQEGKGSTFYFTLPVCLN